MSSQKTVHEELMAIKLLLQKHSHGAAINDIEQNLQIHRRTLQRRLKKLESDHEISVSGRGPSTRYSFANSLPLASTSIDHPISLSPISQDIQKQIERPLSFRYPVGYQKRFLEDYQPNVTAYLSHVEREKLASLAKTQAIEKPAGTYAKHILNRLLIDLSWNSSRLEGNTYSLLDTQRLINFGETAEGKSPTEAQMILNHKAAIEFLVQSAEDTGFNRYTLLNLHALLANNLLPDPQAVGRLRYMSVGITHSIYEPLAIPQLIDECFNLLLEKAASIQDPFEQAFFVMVQMPYLQPFDDVNKRVSRLAVNIPLLRHNLSPLSFVDVPEKIYAQGMLGVYELNRIELIKDVFLWAYERSAARYAAIRQSLGSPDLFRLRYSEEMGTLISDIVIHGSNHKTAKEKIMIQSNALPKEDQMRFIELVETELMCLHEGNFARYKISKAAFSAWHESWINAKLS
jgi:hypothetical protein